MKTFRVAQVGHGIKPTQEDDCRCMSAIVQLIKLCIEHPGRRLWTEDFINLKDGRDFLGENKEYDLVILHSIFHAGDHATSAKDYGVNILEMSPLDSVKAWRKRLTETKAKILVVCEGIPFALSGWQLEEIEGYERVFLDAKLGIYTKKKQS